MFTSSSIFILLPLFCAFNGRALCLFSCAIHLYVFYPREKSHTEVVLRLHNVLWDTDKSHFVRTWSYWMWKTWDCCIFSIDFSSVIILVSFHGSFSPMLSSPPNKVEFSEPNSGVKCKLLKHYMCDLMGAIHLQGLGFIYLKFSCIRVYLKFSAGILRVLRHNATCNNSGVQDKKLKMCSQHTMQSGSP